MKQTLKFHIDDIPLVSSYLHDSNIYIDSIERNIERRYFSMKVARVSYENAKSGRKFGIIPVTKYPSIDSLLSVSNVDSFKTKWFEDTFINDVGYPHELLEMNLERNYRIRMLSDCFEIILFCDAEPEFTLTDISEPSRKTALTDAVGEVFFRNEEIERLVVDSQDE